MSQNKYINKLQGKSVLIFGGTSGIGYAVAEALLEHGAKLTICGSNLDKLANTIERLTKSYPDVKQDRITTAACDLAATATLEDRLREIFEHAVSAHGGQKIDHIVFTAGDPLDVAGGITGTNINVINSISAVRLHAPILIAKVIATTEYVNNSVSTSVTITGGASHLRPRKTWPIVSMVASAMEGLVRGLALDLAPIRFNVVHPGMFQTELASGIPPAALEITKAGTLTKRIGQPEEIAEAYLYFMKDFSADGTALVSDNGKILA
jgi:NAD(P)-dependent dehydrogenase (short-subunit alcohol dehydrogenase family)